MGVPINYGTCSGGPYDKKQMASALAVETVFVDRATKKPVPAMVADTRDSMLIGNYAFEGGLWMWRPIRSASKSAST